MLNRVERYTVEASMTYVYFYGLFAFLSTPKAHLWLASCPFIFPVYRPVCLCCLFDFLTILFASSSSCPLLPLFYLHPVACLSCCLFLMSVCLPVYLSVYRSMSMYLNISTSLFICRPFSVHRLLVYLSIRLSAYLLSYDSLTK